MADKTHIQWTEATWNIVTGCTRISDGCTHCYIERTPPFRIQHRQFDGPQIGATTGVQLHPDRLGWPLRWRKPRRIFVCSLADLFHDEVPDEFIARAFAVMAATPEHTYQVLTKRPARMRSLLRNVHHTFSDAVEEAMAEWTHAGLDHWPLPNVWLGVSVENQQWADNRIRILLGTPAAVRWLSCEPLLGPLDLAGYLPGTPVLFPVECRHGYDICPICDRSLAPDDAISWVVVGGESGPGSRPLHPDWVRSLRDQCVAAGVSTFFKQWGEWLPLGPLYEQADVADEDDESEDARMDAAHLEVVEGREVIELERNGVVAAGYQPGDDRTWLMARVGKKAAGRELDGREWSEYPRAVVAK